MEDDATSVHLINVLSVAQLTPIIDIRAWEDNALWYDENCLLGPFLDVHSSYCFFFFIFVFYLMN